MVSTKVIFIQFILVYFLYFIFVRVFRFACHDFYVAIVMWPAPMFPIKEQFERAVIFKSGHAYFKHVLYTSDTSIAYISWDIRHQVTPRCFCPCMYAQSSPLATLFRSWSLNVLFSTRMIMLSWEFIRSQHYQRYFERFILSNEIFAKCVGPWFLLLDIFFHLVRKRFFAF